MSAPAPSLQAPQPSSRLLAVLFAVFAAVFVWSAIRPHDYFTWFLETVPAMMGLVILAVTYRRFPLTPLLYTLICVHAIVLCVGGHYTYAEVPLFNWIRDAVHGVRNNYDKLGHFVQGFVPAILAREVLLRRTPLKRGGWLFYIVTSICLGFSAFYELFEWRMAVWQGSAADDFLGTQGDPWDTQSDMAMALIGAIVSQLLLSRVHDKQLGAS
jgi:putative membrane protein